MSDYQPTKAIFLCISNEALNGKLERRIRQVSNCTAADQLASIVQLNAADYESEVNKNIFQFNGEALFSFIKEHCAGLM